MVKRVYRKGYIASSNGRGFGLPFSPACRQAGACRKCGGIAFSKMYTFPVIESLPGGLDRGPDVVATEEEVRAIFDKLARDKTFSETRKLGDETGLFLWDVEIPTEDGKTEYSFRRGRAEAGELPGIRIDMAYYDVSGIPISGHSVAKRIKRIWSLTP